jgi:hypothetical protein
MKEIFVTFDFISSGAIGFAEMDVGSMEKLDHSERPLGAGTGQLF